MRSISINFQAHQPFQLSLCRFFDIGRGVHYPDDFQNKYLTERLTEKCYSPANKLILDMFDTYGDAFKCSFAISGTVLDMMEKYSPETIKSFQKLSVNKGAEFLAMPYHNSLAFDKSEDEFMEQTLLHKSKIMSLLGQTPQVFSNSNLIYSDDIGKMVADMGYKGMISEGAKHILGWKSPNFVYHNALNPNLKLLLRNFQFSDDVAFLFSDRTWDSYPLTCEKFIEWLNKLPKDLHCVNICLNYAVLGETQTADTGIFDFIYHLPRVLQENSDFSFKTPTEICNSFESVAPVYVPHAISWDGEEKDLSAWLGNDLQKDAFSKLYDLQEKIEELDDAELCEQWRSLQNADNFYAMNTKRENRQSMQNRFNSPYDAFINYMNILSDFTLKVDNIIAAKSATQQHKKQKASQETPRKKSVSTQKGDSTKEEDQHISGNMLMENPLPEPKERKLKDIDIETEKN